MPVLAPDDAQWAIIVEAERYMNTVGKERDRVGEIPADAPPDHPGRLRLAELTRLSKNHLGRFMSILGSLFVDEEDWDYIRDGMSTRTIKREEIYGLLTAIIAAHNNSTPEPANRADKRKAAKAVRAR